MLYTGCAFSQNATLPSWTTYQGNARHDGYVPVTLDPSTFRVEWSKTLTSSVALQPVTAADGMVYVSQSGYFSGQGLFALSAADGSTLWSQYFPNIFSVNPPAYDDGKVYVQTVNNYGDTWVRAYEATSGQQIFQAAAEAQWENYLAPTIVDHTLYVNGGSYGGMYSFDGVSGARNWFTGLPQYDQWTPAVDAQYAYGYVGGTFHVLARDTGAVVYKIVDPDFNWNGYDMKQATALGTQNDALNINGGRLLSLDLLTHAFRWIKTGGFQSQVSVSDGVIYAVSNGTLVALSEDDGSQLWMWSKSGDPLAGPVIVTNSHVIVSGGTATYAVDLQTHTQVWSYPAAGKLALSDGHLYIADANGALTSVEASDVFIKGADLVATMRNADVSSATLRAYAFIATTKNFGPADATAVSLKIKLPQSFGIKTLDPACTYLSHTLSCKYPRVASGASVTTKNEFIPKWNGYYAVMSRVSAQQGDPKASNNYAVSKLTVE